MNNNDLLFSNKFVKTPDTRDLEKSSVKKFADFYEGKNNKYSGKKTGNVGEKIEFIKNNEIDSNTRTFLRETLVSLDSADRDKYKFPSQNDFEIFLGRAYKNIHSINLVSTEIPNTDTTIKKLPIELKNNLMSWINEEDTSLNIFHNVLFDTNVDNSFDIPIPDHGLEIGKRVKILIFNSKAQTDILITGVLDGYKEVLVIDSNTLRTLYKDGLSIQHSGSVNLGLPVYTVEIIPGNYSASTLTKQIETSLNKIKRRNGSGQFHFFVVSFNVDTNVITLESVITKQLSGNPISTIASSTIITVSALSHGYRTGDIVRMINIQNTASISGLVLSGDFVITVVDFNTFTYEVNTPAVSSTNGGGNNCKTGTMAPFKILFETSNTLIQNNTGFLDEDSSIYIGNSNPITTKILHISDMTSVNSNKDIHITTTTPHNLETSNVLSITSITPGYAPDSISIITSTPHNIQVPIISYIRETNTYPILDGDYMVTPDGEYSLIIFDKMIVTNGNFGKLVWGGDSIRLTGIRCTPSFNPTNTYNVEEIISDYIFKIRLHVIFIDDIDNAIVRTNQVFIKQQNHKFNNITDITQTSGNFVLCKTLLPFDKLGYREDTVSIIDGPSGTNTFDIFLVNHNLKTSDTVIIKNSTTTPIVDGTYTIQIISVDEIRVNLVHTTLVSGTATVITGDTINITNSNSIPRIDGTYHILNRYSITNISTGASVSSITTNTPHNFSIGEQITISQSNSTPSIDGIFTIQSITSASIFTINTTVTSSGSAGIVINNNNFIIELDTPLISSGTRGILGRNQELILYRIKPKDLTDDNIGGIKLYMLNNTLFNVAKLIDSSNYMIRVLGGYATNISTSGGNYVTISSIGDGFRSHQSNTDTGESDGVLSRSINLSGESYLLLQIPNISSMQGVRPLYVSSGITDIFAKLLLKESPGLMVYNGHLSSPLVFNPLIPTMEKINLKTLTKEGYLFNYNNTDWSFSILITEVVDVLENSGKSSRTNNNFKM